MRKVNLNGRQVDYDAVVNLMDDEIRENLHSKFINGVTDQDFVDAYVDEHCVKFNGEEFTI